MSKRSCAECGAAKRMADRPEDTDLCAFCAGEVRHPFYEPPPPTTTFMKGYYTDQKGHEASRRSPGQGAID